MVEIGYDAGDRGEPEYPEEHVHEYCFGVTLLSKMVERLRDPALVECDHCDHVLNEAEILSRLNEYDRLKNATERLEETNKGLFNIIKAYHPEYIDGCECPQCGDMPIYFDTQEGK